MGFYERYISGPKWAEVRKAKLELVGYCCQGCGDRERLEVHHLSYDRLGNERLEDLMVLCHLCHAQEHGRTPNVGPIAGPSLEVFADRAHERQLLDAPQREDRRKATLKEVLEEAHQLSEKRKRNREMRRLEKRYANRRHNRSTPFSGDVSLDKPTKPAGDTPLRAKTGRAP